MLTAQKGVPMNLKEMMDIVMLFDNASEEIKELVLTILKESRPPLAHRDQPRRTDQ
jgi:hypothetical protein